MDRPKTIDHALAGSSLGPSLEGLREIYERIDAEQAASLAAIAARGEGLSCPADCGTCCEGFVPDILPVEARYLAAWLLRERPALAARVLAWDDGGAPEAPPCPFHEPERPGGHCGVYPGRPLVCRLFGFAAVRDREGRPSYSLCRLMPGRGGKRSWSGAELAGELGAELPDMASFGALACALVPDETGQRSLLTEALPDALRRLSLVLRLSFLAAADRGRPDGGDEPEPEPNAPAPAPRAA